MAFDAPISLLVHGYLFRTGLVMSLKALKHERSENIGGLECLYGFLLHRDDLVTLVHPKVPMAE